MRKPAGNRDLALIASDPDTFEAFYRQHIDAVRLFVVRRVADPHLAADLITDVFLAALESAKSYKPGRGTPTQWLYGIARNVLAAERRKSTKHHDAERRISGQALLDEDDVAELLDRIEPRRRLASSTKRWTDWTTTIGGSWSWSRSMA